MRWTSASRSARRSRSGSVCRGRATSPARAHAFHADLRERLAALPGVEAVGAIGTCLPLAGRMCWGEGLRVEGRPPVEGEAPPVTDARVVAGDYFAAMGIRVRGR